MKILSLHCDYLKYQIQKKALQSVEDIKDKEEITIKEPLVLFISIESGDEISLSKATEALVENAIDLMTKTMAKKIVLYPYAHLSSDLSKPDFAQDVLKQAEKQIKAKNIEVYRAPFGYYKSFELKCKGHPLSELTRRIDLSDSKKEIEQARELSETERKKMLREMSKSKLDTSKLKENDHRIIGQKMDLWSFNNAAPGMVFWHPKGLIIKNSLVDYWREIHRDAGYVEISTPQIMDKKLWEVSGHWAKYKDAMFTSDYEEKDIAVKPMNCPGGMLVFKATPKSYKDLPLRMGELGIVHRQELSGVLGGLFRVIQFTQDDAHIFCDRKTIENEIVKIIDIIDNVYNQLSLKFDHVELSTRPEKRIGSNEIWDNAERVLENVLKKRKIKYKINKGQGAFYGPKIDFHLKDSLNRTWQCSTIQLDFALPERFELEYTDKDDMVRRPIMIHRVVYGSIERIIGILTEHLNGKFPLWLSPNQIKIITLNENQKAKDYARKIFNQLFKEGFRVEIDDSNETLAKKARDAQIQRFNYIITIGDNEIKAKNISVKKRDDSKIAKTQLEKFIKQLNEEIKNRK